MFHQDHIQSMYQWLHLIKSPPVPTKHIWPAGNNHLFTIFLMSNKSISSFVVLVLLGVIAMIVSDDQISGMFLFYIYLLSVLF